ncbi:gamma-glutamylcyclotransferase [Methylocella sp.]|uniref:gamma-glutamylcyclotransferase n=1 Tax=Methylocella sp. TaxID=1978226 RepID=UPI003784EBDC
MAEPRAADDLWVFGYGSLMWRPGFDFVERRDATVRGYRRALCVYSHVHRGTVETPGLVLGLDRGGACRGVAFRVEAARREATLDYLRAREQATAVYREILLPARLRGGGTVSAVAYVADRRHVQYAGRLDRPELARLVRQGVGISGPNVEYVLNTCAHLVELSIRDATFEWLAREFGDPAETDAAQAGRGSGGENQGGKKQG